MTVDDLDARVTTAIEHADTLEPGSAAAAEAHLAVSLLEEQIAARV